MFLSEEAGEGSRGCPLACTPPAGRPAVLLPGRYRHLWPSRRLLPAVLGRLDTLLLAWPVRAPACGLPPPSLRASVMFLSEEAGGDAGTRPAACGSRLAPASPQRTW